MGLQTSHGFKTWKWSILPIASQLSLYFSRKLNIDWLRCIQWYHSDWKIIMRISNPQDSDWKIRWLNQGLWYTVTSSKFLGNISLQQGSRNLHKKMHLQSEPWHQWQGHAEEYSFQFMMHSLFGIVVLSGRVVGIYLFSYIWSLAWAEDNSPFFPLSGIS